MYTNRLLLLIRQYIYWLIIFKLGHLFFLLYHYQSSSDLSVLTWLHALGIATRLDLSMAGYIMIFPGLLYAVTFFTSRPAAIINIYHISLMTIYAMLLSIDVGLYGEWGFRLDLTPLQYINTPGAMMASLSFTDILKQITVAVVLCCIFFSLFRQWTTKKKITPASGSLHKRSLLSLLFLFTISLLIIPIRGSFGKSTINQSSVYFHANAFVNHSCINVPWNIIHSAVYWDNNHADYSWMNDSLAQLERGYTIQTDFYPTSGILRTRRPNVILIILESFGYQTSCSLGGNDSIATQINALRQEGLYFSRCYATGDRTNKAIPALLAGYPAIPNQPILNSPKKVSTLPTLAGRLNEHGYHTAFYYGGEIDFAQINSMVRTASYQEVRAKHNIKNDTSTSWGYPDHVVYNQVLRDLATKALPDTKPFFTTILTLSSHRPFDVPMQPVFQDDQDPWTGYNNAVYYADHSLGHFIRSAKKKKWWSNTLLILVGDHGITIRNQPAYYAPIKFKIPMLWLGGALQTQDSILTKVCSQTDIAGTLLETMHIKHDMQFSRNLFNPSVNDFAYYCYNDGFGIVHDTNAIAYSLIQEKSIFHLKKPFTALEKQGKAYLQSLSKDFNAR